jgi:hypothetical protein
MSNWIRSAEAALAGRPSDDITVDVLPRHAPALIDADGVRALVSPFLAAFMWAAAVFRDTQAHHTLDPLALLFRVLAFALTLRALRLLIQLAHRLRVRLRLGQYGLALTPEGLLFRSPAADVVVPRAEVLDVREHGADWGNKTGQRWADVYVITHPDSGRLCITLPPVFERTPGVLAETLMRWRGVDAGHPPPANAQDTSAADGSSADATRSEPRAPIEPLASKLWERTAGGERLPAVTAVRHGSAWLQRGPYASVLLGLAVLEGYIRLPANARVQVELGPSLMLVAALVLMPLSWVVLTRINLAPRKGLALVLTPTELLARTRAGVQRVAWANVTKVTVSSRAAWSILQGAHQNRQLVVSQKRETSFQCSETFLSVPAEVVAGLCEAYRKGLVHE